MKGVKGFSYARRKPTGFLIYCNGQLVVNHTVSASVVKGFEKIDPNLEVFGIHPIVGLER